MTRFAQLLQAELTTAALAGDRKEAPEAKVKQLQQGSDKPATKVACGNWRTASGCARGASCRFAHDWAGVQDKNDRCWTCSSLGHRKQECPAGDKTKSPEKAENKGKDTKEGKDHTSGKGKGKAAGKGNLSSTRRHHRLQQRLPELQQPVMLLAGGVEVHKKMQRIRL